MNNIGQRIKELRKKNDLTQEKLADFLGVTYQSVSKWECGTTMPDISLIVPLARLFNVSTDELFGMTDPGEDEKKKEYDSLLKTAHGPDQLEIATRAVSEFPGELKYVMWQADCLYMLAFEDYKDQESFYEELEKPLKLYIMVFENTEDSETKRKALAGIVMNLESLRRYDEAKKYAELYPDTPVIDKDTVIGWTLTGEEKVKHLQEKIMHALDEIVRTMLDVKDADNPNLKRMSYLLCAEQFIRTAIPDGNFLRYYDDLLIISVYKAHIYQHNDPEKAIEALRDAKRYAMEFDRLFMEEPTVRAFTSPFFDLLSFDSADLLWYGPLEENKRIDNFKWWLSGAHFDSIRNREDFKALLD